jgi:hypothetical protein
MRRDLRQLHLLDDDIVRLRLLTAYRADLALTRPAASTGSATCSSASFLPWNEFWTSPTRTR